MFNTFQTNLRKNENGELRINMNRASEIEQITKDSSFKKFYPPGYEGSLRQIV